MSPHPDALDSATRAAQGIRSVAERWNAVDHAALKDSVSGLERSIGDLRAALDGLKSLPLPARGVLRSTILDLKKDAARIERLVGASAAFLRSAPGLASDHDGIYQAGGAVMHVASSFEIRGLQG